jgi:hypothetical protein
MANESTTKENPPVPKKNFSDAHHVHVGPILGVLVVVLVIILGGLYLWGGMLSKQAILETPERTIPNNEPETPRAVADQDILMTTSSSIEIDAINADLESTNLTDLDRELDSISSEMNAIMR